MMGMGESGILRIVTASLATLLIGLPAAWAVLALYTVLFLLAAAFIFRRQEAQA